jgi:hypothetical protein
MLFVTYITLNTSHKSHSIMTIFFALMHTNAQLKMIISMITGGISNLLQQKLLWFSAVYLSLLMMPHLWLWNSIHQSDGVRITRIDSRMQMYFQMQFSCCFIFFQILGWYNSLKHIWWIIPVSVNCLQNFGFDQRLLYNANIVAYRIDDTVYGSQMGTSPRIVIVVVTVGGKGIPSRL